MTLVEPGGHWGMFPITSLVSIPFILMKVLYQTVNNTLASTQHKSVWDSGWALRTYVTYKLSGDGDVHSER